ncbi:hypothetical protein ACFVP3_33130 [Streptomyces sp. NPDC057806]|uniref:hypothetical protein n=1 Tax=unclassified Streptomyces TaxID=2593676 RepID=UPI003684DB8F
MAPLRNRHLAAGFIVVMYALIGGLVAGALAAGVLQSEVGANAGAVVGAVLGAAIGVWRIRRTPEEERADDGGY